MRPHATEYTQELIEAYQSGEYLIIPRFWYLELISENPSGDYADFWFDELLKYPEYGHQGFILGVLSEMSRDVRKRVWHLREATEKETEAFRNIVDDKFWWSIQKCKKE